MRQILTITFAFLFLLSCDNSDDIDSFKTNDVAQINKEIQVNKNEDWVKTPLSIINKVYSIQDRSETGGTYTIEQHYKDNLILITLTQEQLPDDCVFGEKRIISFKQIDNLLTILSVKIGYKCSEGRGGHSNYSGEGCP